jgi:hypothetical protein
LICGYPIGGVLGDTWDYFGVSSVLYFLLPAGADVTYFSFVDQCKRSLLSFVDTVAEFTLGA